MSISTVPSKAPKKAQLGVKAKDLDCLIGEHFVNENIIIAYLELIKFRSTHNPNLPKVTFLDTNFMSQLRCPGPKQQQFFARWIKETNVFKYDIILIPFLLNDNHWALICVDFKRKVATLYDSSPDVQDAEEFQRLILNVFRWDAAFWNEREMFNSIETWRVLRERRWPKQTNNNDCGTFLCMYAEALSIRSPPIFNTKYMNYQRVKIMIEILECKLKEADYGLSYYVDNAKRILEFGSLQLGWVPGFNYLD